MRRSSCLEMHGKEKSEVLVFIYVINVMFIYDSGKVKVSLYSQTQSSVVHYLLDGLILLCSLFLSLFFVSKNSKFDCLLLHNY
jgi:hypothetical protein